MARRPKEGERLDPASIERVIEHISNKGTKKDACNMLNIAYNTTRLNSIIEKYLEDKAKIAARRAEKRGKPPTPDEISYVIQSYLEGDTLDNISTSLFRSSSFVNSILAKNDVPRRQSAHSYFRPEIVPDEACKDTFAEKEKVYSMRYDSLALIEAEVKPGIYRIYLLADKWKQFAYQPVEELASLAHLRSLGINV